MCYREKTKSSTDRIFKKSRYHTSLSHSRASTTHGMFHCISIALIISTRHVALSLFYMLSLACFHFQKYSAATIIYIVDSKYSKIKCSRCCKSTPTQQLFDPISQHEPTFCLPLMVYSTTIPNRTFSCSEHFICKLIRTF